MGYNLDYIKLSAELLKEIDLKLTDDILELAEKFSENIRRNKVIHMFGTGHSHLAGIELFARAGGLGNINAMLDPDAISSMGARRSGSLERISGIADVIYDSYNIKKGDIMVITSNSGRNAVPIEMAMRAKSEGIYTIALTNLTQSKKASSRHESGKKLYEIVDKVLDNCVPEGDSMMKIAGIKTAPASSISNIVILNSIVNEALKILARDDEKLPVFQSQNVDGFDNDDIYEKYEDRVKHF